MHGNYACVGTVLLCYCATVGTGKYALGRWGAGRTDRQMQRRPSPAGIFGGQEHLEQLLPAKR